MPIEVDTGGEADVTASGDPPDTLLWLWGRAADGVVRLAGDRDTAHRRCQRLVLATQ